MQVLEVYDLEINVEHVWWQINENYKFSVASVKIYAIINNRKSEQKHRNGCSVKKTKWKTRINWNSQEFPRVFL